MFDILFKRPYYIKRHVNAPFLNERIAYIQQRVKPRYMRFFYISRCTITSPDFLLQG